MRKITEAERNARIELSRLARAPHAEHRTGADTSEKVGIWRANFAGCRYRLAVGVGGPDEQPRAFLTLRGARHLRRRLDAAIKALERRKVLREPLRWPWCPLCGVDSPNGAICPVCDVGALCERCRERPATCAVGGHDEDGREWGGWHLCGPCSALAPGSRMDTFRRQPGASDDAAVCAECGAPLDHPSCGVGHLRAVAVSLAARLAAADHEHCGCTFCAVCDEVPR